jgi:membrane protein YqaA with SNARE-associated domain
VTKKQLTLARIVAALIVIGLSVFIYSLRDRAEELAIYGYPGIFILAFMSYATVLLPAPGLWVIFTMGAVFNPLAVALVAATGATLGEISGYLAGFSGQAVIERTDIYDRLSRWMRSNGPLTIFLLSVLPNPFFDIAGVAAGMLKMRLQVFLFYCWLGETGKMLLFAFAGSGILNRFF